MMQFQLWRIIREIREQNFRGNGFLPAVFCPGMNMAEIAYLYRGARNPMTGYRRHIPCA